MLGNGQVEQCPHTMASPSPNHHYSQSPEARRFRNKSDAMDIYMITDRDIAREDAPGYSPSNRNGSPSMNSTNSKYFSLIPFQFYPVTASPTCRFPP